MKITTQMLTKRKACAAQVALFKKLFGPEAEVTLDNCLTAVEAGLSIDWAAEKLLSPERLQAYNAATAGPRRAYDAATEDAEQAYWAAMAEAFYHAATEDTE